MGLEIRSIGILISLEMRGLHDVFQHVPDIPVDFRLGKGSFLDGVYDTVDFPLVSGLHQVIAGFGRLHGVLLTAPVRHHYSVKAPLVAQCSSQEFLLLLGVLTVELVI